MNRLAFSVFKRVPIFGNILLILNSYVSNGDAYANDRFEGVFSWLFKLGPNIIVACVAAIITTPVEATFSISSILPDFVLNAVPVSYSTVFHSPIFSILPKLDSPNGGELILSILPNLLGFGIGVYGLIFGLSASFVKKVQSELSQSENPNSPNKEEARSRKTVLVLNADMAYPLLVMTLTIAIGVLSKSFPTSSLIHTISVFSFWYSMVMLLEVLVTLFHTGEALLMTKVASTAESTNE